MKISKLTRHVDSKAEAARRRVGNVLYISRAKAKRRVLNEEQELRSLVARTTAQAGQGSYREIVMEDHDVGEQIRAMQNASIIVLQHGAATAIAALAAPGTLILLLVHSTSGSPQTDLMPPWLGVSTVRVLSGGNFDTRARMVSAWRVRVGTALRELIAWSAGRGGAASVV